MWGSWRGEAYTYALLDQVVLVAFQLLFQPVRFEFHLLRRLVYPCEVERCVRVVWDNLSECRNSVSIASNIFPLLRFCNGGFESFVVEVGRRFPDV